MAPADEAMTADELEVERLLADLRETADRITAQTPAQLPAGRRVRRPSRRTVVVGVIVVLAVVALVVPLPRLHLFGSGQTPSHPGKGRTSGLRIVTSTLPPAVGQTMMAYFPPRDEVVLFGGQASSSWVATNQTWVFDSSGWHELHPTVSPPSIEDASMAYDPSLRELVLYGGSTRPTPDSGRPVQETWVFDGLDWKQIVTAHSPAYLPVAIVALDSATGQLTALAPPPGYGPNPPTGDFEVRPTSPPLDRWIFTGTTWLHRSDKPGPPIEIGAAAFVQASVSGQMLYYTYNFPSPSCGGLQPCVPPDPTGTRYSETWTWNGSAFERQHPSTAPDLSLLVTYDSALGEAVAIDRAGRLWTWSNGNWVVHAGNPALAQAQAIAYDAQLRAIVVYGTGKNGRDTWLWNGATWSLVVQR